MLRNAWLIPLLPVLSFVAILLVGKHLPRRGAEIGVGAVGTSFLLSCIAAFQWIDKVEDALGHEEGVRALGRGMVAGGEGAGGEELAVAPVVRTVTWWSNGGIEVRAGTSIDGLAVMMLFVVTLVSLLVHVYSTKYMEGDRRFTHYYALLSLFTAAMLNLVVANNTLQLLVGWELVGLCSFVLIGHWWEEKPNQDSAVKAFLTTRIGDVGFLIGIVILFFAAGTFDIRSTNEQAVSGEIGHTLLLVASAALMCGIVGKSGQFPLHTWLPDAMAGPTPVSALIHAATMVVAGVYFGARLYPVFYNGFSIGSGGVNAMALIGGITVIIGALLAFVQVDIKRVLAYSTISQIGYMVMALGVGAWVAAVFHLFTHAFFKALLFLGAGSVSHSGSHHSFDMKRDMGGLRAYMPITFWTFIVGSLALAGIFPFAGFWSKDEILVTAGEAGFEFFFVVGLVGAFMTAAYMTRCVYLTFLGEYRGHGHPHESPPAITVPLVILAAFSVAAGWVNATAVDVEKFGEWVEAGAVLPVLEHAEFDSVGAGVALLVVVLGIAAGAAYWFRGTFRGLTERNRTARAGYVFLENKYYLDYLYTDLIVGSIKSAVARATYWFDQHVIDAVVNGLGRGTARVGTYTYDVLDQRVVDAAVNGLAATTGETGGLLRYIQSGRVQRYALMLFAAVGLLSLALVLFN